MHDREAKFTESFDGVLESANLEVIKAAHRSPNTVAFSVSSRPCSRNGWITS
jgi:hypothetical protein